MRSFLFFAFCFFLSNAIVSQCDQPEEIVREGLTYFGCLNDSEEMHGYGTLTRTEGDIKQIQSGVFEYDVFLNGEITLLDHGDTTLYQKGEFNRHSQHLKTGISKHYGSLTFQCGASEITPENTIRIVTYKDYEVLDESSNFDNHYNAKDIISKGDSTYVHIDTRNSHQYITVKINKVEGEWMFDTGGGDLSIGYNLWSRIIDQVDVEYENLNIETCGMGVGGHPNFYDTFQLNNLKLGDFTVNNVVVSVAHDPGNNDNLMGLGFCKKFSDVQWSLINEKVLFIK